MSIENDDLLSESISRRVFSEYDQQRILSEKTNADKVECLLQILMRKSEDKYLNFIEALDNSNQEHVANLMYGQNLECELLPKFSEITTEQTEAVVEVELRETLQKEFVQTNSFSEEAETEQRDETAVKSIMNEWDLEVTDVKQGSIIVIFRCHSSKYLTSEFAKQLSSAFTETYCPLFSNRGLNSLEIIVSDEKRKNCIVALNQKFLTQMQYDCLVEHNDQLVSKMKVDQSFLESLPLTRRQRQAIDTEICSQDKARVLLTFIQRHSQLMLEKFTEALMNTEQLDAAQILWWNDSPRRQMKSLILNSSQFEATHFEDGEASFSSCLSEMTDFAIMDCQATAIRERVEESASMACRLERQTQRTLERLQSSSEYSTNINLGTDVTVNEPTAFVDTTYFDDETANMALNVKRIEQLQLHKYMHIAKDTENSSAQGTMSSVDDSQTDPGERRMTKLMFMQELNHERQVIEDQLKRHADQLVEQELDLIQRVNAVAEREAQLMKHQVDINKREGPLLQVSTEPDEQNLLQAVTSNEAEIQALDIPTLREIQKPNSIARKVANTFANIYSWYKPRYRENMEPNISEWDDPIVEPHATTSIEIERQLSDDPILDPWESEARALPPVETTSRKELQRASRRTQKREKQELPNTPWFSSLFRRNIFGRDECEGEDMEFDVYISCASEDEEIFAINDMLLFLESAGFKCCFRDRDFPLGSLIFDSIDGAVARSKRTLCFVSSSFINSYLCMCDFEVALSQNLLLGKNRLIVALLGGYPDLDGDDYSIHSLKSYLSNNTYLDYSSADFRKKLLRAMPRNKLGSRSDAMNCGFIPIEAVESAAEV